MVMIIPISKKNRQYNGQKKKGKRTNSDLQNITHKPKDRVTRTRAELWCYGRARSFCCTSGTRRVNIVTNPVISLEWGRDQEVFATSGTYPWSFVTQIFHNGQSSHGDDRQIFEAMTSTLPIRTFGPEGSLLAANLLSRESW